MKVELLIDEANPRRWHGRLAAGLSACGHECFFKRIPVRPPRQPALDCLLLMDRLLHSRSDHALDAAGLPFPDQTGRPVLPDVTIDLTGVRVFPQAAHHLVPLFDGLPGEGALWSALLDGRAPRLSLYDGGTQETIPIGLPAIEAPHQLMASADLVIARLVAGIFRAVNRPLPGTPNPGNNLNLPRMESMQCLSALTTIVSGKAQRALERLLHRAPQWTVAWSGFSGASSHLPEETIDLSRWTFLPDDGRRYYADPFVAGGAEQRFLFVEEFPYATGRGLISAVEIDRNGRAMTAPQPVLEASFHLSYPQIFQDGGVTYMLPEAAASGKLTLYRAERFPDRWVAVADLLHERVHDATLFQFDGAYWLSAATEGDGGSSWDALCLYRAASLLGPWTPHAMNPVLVDASSARPAGGLFSSGGALWRPAQDCRGGYGAALALARVDALAADAFSQVVERTLTAPSGFTGFHTWNRAFGLEAIDLFGPRRLPVA